MSQFSHSRIVQKDVYQTSLQSVSQAFGRDANEVPLVLIPNVPGCCCCTLMLDVPSSHHVLWEHYTKAVDDQYGAGLQFCVCFYDRISHIVSGSTITYNAPSVNVPTADNILVDLNCVVTFKIQTKEDASTFVYQLGANRLDAVLSAECEEGIRNLVYSTNHKEVLDLFGNSEKTSQIRHSLSEKLRIFGITIIDIVILEGKLPQDLQARLERTTTMISEIEDAKKQHENEKKKIEYDGEQKIMEIEKENKRRIQALQREIERFEIESEEWEATARAKVEVELTQARSEVEVQQIKCRADEQLAEVEGQRYRTELIRSTQTECDKKLTATRQQAQSMQAEADAQLEVAQSKAQGIIAKARAEEAATLKLAEKRRYELEWERLSIMSEIAAKGRRVITGERAEQLMSDLCPTSASMAR